MGSPRHLAVPEGSGDADVDTTPTEPVVGASGTEVSACIFCGRLIGWELTAKGHPRPIDPDGKPHAATCSRRMRSTAAFNECGYCHSTNTHRGPGDDRVPAIARLICDDCHRQRWLPYAAGIA
jgi:hypothetical protein